MRSKLGSLSVALVLGGAAAGLAQSCGEKKVAPAASSKNDCSGSTKLTCASKDDDDDDSGSGTGTSDSGSPTATSFDLCKTAGANSTVKGSPLFAKICNDIAAQRKAAYDGSNGTPSNPNPVVSGKNVSVESTASSLVEASVDDYYKMMKMQVNNASAFKAAGFKRDPNAKVENKTGSDDAPSYTYTNDNGDGAVTYDATSTFVTIKSGVAYAQVTEQIHGDDPKTYERMTSMKGLIIIEKKDATHTYVYTSTNQQYEESGEETAAEAHAKDQLAPKIKSSLKNEQLYSIDNAKMAKAKAQ